VKVDTSETFGLKKTVSGYILKNNRHQFFYFATATIFLRYYNTFRPESNQIYSKVRYLFRIRIGLQSGISVCEYMSVYGYILQKNRVGRSDFHFILFFHFISHTEIPDCRPIRIRKRYRILYNRKLVQQFFWGIITPSHRRAIKYILKSGTFSGYG
jgi:hypothetical protein